MSTLYLLPCSCGEKLQVEIRQAGESIVCTCGKSLDIPTLRALRQLDSVSEPSNPSARSRWSPLQGVLFVAGSALLIISLATNTFLLLIIREGAKPTRLSSSNPKATVREELADLSPEEAWLEWQTLREIPERAKLRQQRGTGFDRDRFDRYIRVATIVAVVGVALAGSAIVVRPR